MSLALVNLVGWLQYKNGNFSHRCFFLEERGQQIIINVLQCGLLQVLLLSTFCSPRDYAGGREDAFACM